MYPLLTPQQAAEALATVGVPVDGDRLRIEAREERWLVRLPGHRLAWFAASTEGHRRLQVERRVLRLLEARCSFEAPRILVEASGGAFDVRAGVPGTADPWRVYGRLCSDPGLGARLGREVGAILAQQHTRIGARDVAGWLPRCPGWPEGPEWVRERLARVADVELRARADTVLAMYEAVNPPETDRVLVHGDVGLHNLAIDMASFAVGGIFDYDGAAWADRHHDFRYLLFDHEGDDVLEGAVAVYEPAVGCVISRPRVALYNAACAIGFLAHRADRRADELCCGRTLREDLRWTAVAIGRALRE